MKRVLILSLNWGRFPYNRLLTAQQNTWGTLAWPGVETWFYKNTPGQPDATSFNLLTFDIEDGSDQLPLMLSKALEKLWNHDWDFVFRTNASSFVCPRRLWEKVQSMPANGVYEGVPVRLYGRYFHYGEGVLMSRDVAAIVKDAAPEVTHELEDQWIGRVITERGIGLLLERFRWDFYAYEMPCPDTFHYRCKGTQFWEQDDPARDKDIHAMGYLFEMKKPLYGLE